MLAFAALLLTLQDDEIRFNPADAYGKTANEVVSMGYDKWDKFYHNKVGDYTTASMSNSISIFGTALYETNSQALQKLDEKRQATLKTVRNALLLLVSEYNGLASMTSGGGTMWIPLRAGSIYESEKYFKDQFLAKKYKGQTSDKDMSARLEKTGKLMQEDIVALAPSRDELLSMKESNDSVILALSALIKARAELSGVEVAGINHFVYTLFKGYDEVRLGG
ncbi:MAG: hypothetical protein KDC26_06280 [Armatimonadetes bacterium]|nr:hypothetical protein [Armatimonadota bacterium]